MIKYIKDNVEWIFSGIGVSIIVGIITILLTIIKLVFTKRQSNGDGSIQIKNIKAGRDVTIKGGNKVE